MQSVGRANPFAIEHMVRGPRPPANAIFEFNGRLGRIGNRHPVSRLRLKFIGTAIRSAVKAIPRC